VREELSEREALMALLRKKAKNSTVKMDYRDKIKLARSLMGKGFSPDLIFTTLRTTKEEFVDEGE
jgi:SOS response regulatory protein OraA/RecX